MQLKVIQINIYRGKFLDELVDFLRAEQPDIVTMQEVSGGKVNNWSDQSIDTFQYIKSALRMEGAVAPMYRLVGDPTAYEGNAVFVRGKILNTKILWLKKYREYDQVPGIKEGPDEPRTMLDLRVELMGNIFHALGIHCAWTKEPMDTPEKIRQARMFADYLRALEDAPFVLGGDFNMEPGSEVVKTIDAVARNAVYGSAVKNTLNLRTHRAAAQLPKEGRLVDFIYTSSHFRVESIDASEVDVSDHLPVRAVLSLN